MIPDWDEWEAFCHPWTWCLRCQTRSPVHESPDDAITWAETHPCAAAAAA